MNRDYLPVEGQHGEGQRFCSLGNDCLVFTCSSFGLWSPLHDAYFLEGQVNNLLGRVRHVTHYLD